MRELNRSWLFLVVALAGPLSTAQAADPPKVKVETVISGLDNPMALAFRPGANDLLISESGAGQVVKVLTDKPGKPTAVVTGFPVAAAPSPLGFQVGPLGIVFLDRVTFIVGTGGLKAGHDVIAIYGVPSGDKSLKFEDARRK